MLAGEGVDYEVRALLESEDYSLLFSSEDEEDHRLLFEHTTRTAALRSNSSQTKKRRLRNRHRDRGFALKEMNHLSDAEFTRMFRVNRYLFYEVLLPKIRDKVGLSYIGKIRALSSSGSYVSATTRLAVALRWLAGGSYLDICFSFGISFGSFYHVDGVLWKTICAIDSSFSIGFPLHDQEELRRTAKGFATFSNQALNGCVMAVVDGWVCKTRAPYKHEVQNTGNQHHRKAQ